MASCVVSSLQSMDYFYPYSCETQGQKTDFFFIAVVFDSSTLYWALSHFEAVFD